MNITTRMSLAVAYLGLCLIVFSCTSATEPTRTLVPGQRVPAIPLLDLEGSQTSLSAFSGKVVVLNVWATWCAPCRRELPSLERMKNKLDPEHFAVVALSVDSDEHIVREYLRDKQITLVSYLDRDGALATSVLEVNSFPDTLIISREGILLARIAGEREWDQPQIIEAIQHLSSGDFSKLKMALQPEK